MKKIYLVLVFILLFCSFIGFSQFEIPAKPLTKTLVHDYAQLLQSDQKQQLEQKLVRYSDSTSNQIAVVIIPSAKGEDIAVLATNWAQKWGVGDKNKDNGVILFIAINDRKMSIRPGYGVEDRLIAATCGEIIRKVIKPEFKTGNYYQGIDNGTSVIIDVLKGKYKGEPKVNEGEGIPIGLIIFIIIIIIFLISRSKNNGNNGSRSGGFDLTDIIILSSMGRGSGGGSFGGGFSGGNSGGGFGGFGGGGFSGGGASGDW